MPLQTDLKGHIVLEKIISGGHLGPERAALDVAIKMDIAFDGWVLKGAKKALPTKYNLKEMASKDPIMAVKKNIEKADGTLFLYRNMPKKDLELAKKVIKDQKKPYLLMDLGIISKFEGSLAICKWIVEEEIETLNISGETGDDAASIHHDVMDILESVIYLGHTEYSEPLKAEFPLAVQKQPETIDEAITLLLDEMPLKDKVLIANMTGGELVSLDASLGRFIRDSFGLWTGNLPLVESCRDRENDRNLKEEHVPMVIIKSLWETLKKTHRLRLIK